MLFPWAWIALGFAAVAKKEKWPALLLLMTLPAWTLLLQLPRQRYRDRSAVRIMTCNADYFGNVQLHDRVQNGKTIDQIIGMLETEKPDILCGQDFTGDYVSELPLRRYLNSSLPHRIETGTSLALFSKFRILDWQAYWFPQSYNGYLRADLDVDGTRVRIFNVHLQSYALAESKSLRQLASKFKWGLKDRAEQAEWVAQDVAWSKLPVIVCGDFNDPPTSHAYKTIARGLKDAFQEKGRGRGFTYAGYIPLLRIDYVLCSPNLEIVDCYVNRNTTISDHYPVVTDLRL